MENNLWRLQKRNDEQDIWNHHQSCIHKETIQISALGKECLLFLVNVYTSLSARAHAYIQHLGGLVIVPGAGLFSKACAIWELPEEATPTCSLYPKKANLRTWKGSRTGGIRDAKKGQTADQGRHITINDKLNTGSPLASLQPVSQ